MRLLATLTFLLLLATPGMAAPDRYTEPQPCAAPSPGTPVCLADRAWTVADAERALGPRDATAYAESGVLNIVARRAAGPVSLCCSIVAPLNRIAGSDLWTLSLRVFDLDRAIVDIQVSPPAGMPGVPVYRGAEVPPVDAPEQLAGKLVSETLASTALGERRQLTVYLPPGFSAQERYPVVYLADGFALPGFAAAIEAEIVSGRVAPLIVVGIWPGARDPKERSREYLPDRLPGRYRAHAQFVIDEVLPFVERNCGASPRREDRMLAGFSDGAAWALSMGLAHSDLFGSVAVFSFGWQAAAAGIERSNRPRIFLAAGRLEPDFYKTTLATARRAQRAGGDVRFEDYTSGHTLFAWQSMLLDALAWGFAQR